MVNLDRCNGSCNTLDNANKTENVNLNVFNLIARINESKALTKHTSCGFKCEFDSRKYNSNQKWNNDKC